MGMAAKATPGNEEGKSRLDDDADGVAKINCDSADASQVGAKCRQAGGAANGVHLSRKLGIVPSSGSIGSDECKI